MERRFHYEEDLWGNQQPEEPMKSLKSERRGVMLHTGLFTSETDEWPTPQALFDQFNEKYHFTLDPCATPENAKCEKFFTKEQDGLKQEWTGNVFMNPPYGRQISLWVEKAWKSSQEGATVVCLLPARTDTRWWHTYCEKGEVTFLKGRVKFGGAKSGAPFPSAIVVFKGKARQEGMSRERF